MLVTIIPTREVAKTLRTGALTSYMNYDDAYYAALGLGIPKSYLILSVETQYTGTTAIVVNGKTDNHSNICVLDLKTGLMWSQTVSASVGPASNGKLPRTTTGSWRDGVLSRIKKEMTRTEIEERTNKALFMNHNDKALGAGMREFLQARFPNPSRWE